MIPSITAIQRAIRILRTRSQRPVRVERCSIAPPPCPSDSLAPIASTVPSWHGEPNAAVAPQLALGRGCRVAMQEEAVHGGPGAADIRAEGAEVPQLGGERRGGQVVRRQVREIAGSPRARESLGELRSATVE